MTDLGLITGFELKENKWTSNQVSEGECTYIAEIEVKGRTRCMGIAFNSQPAAADSIIEGRIRRANASLEVIAEPERRSRESYTIFEAAEYFYSQGFYSQGIRR